MEQARIFQTLLGSLLISGVFAQAGSLDPTFGTGGRVTTDIGSGSYRCNAVLVQPDGRIVSGGTASYFPQWGSFLLMRHNTDGTLDDSFGGDGIVSTTINAGDAIWTPGVGSESEIYDMALQPDGKIIAAGRSFTMISGSGTNRLALARYNVDGTLDTTFGSGGWIVDLDVYSIECNVSLMPDGRIVVAASNGFTSFYVLRFHPDGTHDLTLDGDGVLIGQVTPAAHSIGAVAVLPDGRIIVGGAIYNGTDDDVFVSRYNEDGSPDPSLNGSGYFISAPGIYHDRLYDMVVFDDGTMTIAGTTVLVPWDIEFLLQRFHADGTPDASFGVNGTTTTSVSPMSANLTALAIQADSSLVACGNSGWSAPEVMVARYTPSGQLDPAFDGDGIVQFGLAPDGPYVNDVAVGPGGTIALAGSASIDNLNVEFDALTMGLASNGAMDASFSSDGIEQVDAGIGGDLGLVVARQPDGRSLVAGMVSFGTVSGAGLVRYNVDGSLDPTFGTDGLAMISGDRPACVTVQSDGKILIGMEYSFSVYRLNTDGTMDTGFNGTGIVTITEFIGTGQTGAVRGIVVQPDGKIVAAGYAGPWSVEKYFALVRLNPDGSLDTSFDGDGKVTADFGWGVYDEIFAAAIQDDGKILVAGYAGNFDGFTVIRYDANGGVDASFSGDGIVTVPLLGYTDRPHGLALRPDGRIIVAGSSMDGVNADLEIAVVSLMPNGTLDPSFGTGGKVITDLAGTNDEATGLALQPDGKVLVGGSTIQGNTDDFLLLRYTAIGEADDTFDGDGVVTTSFGSGAERANGAVLQPDGKVLLAGFAVTESDIDFALARYDLGALSAVAGDQATGSGQMAVWPDPMVNGSVVAFDLRTSGSVTLRLHDIHGRVVKTILDRRMMASGPHEVVLTDVNGLACGTYVLEMQAGDARSELKVMR